MNEKNLLQSLFDFSFSEFVTTRLIRFIFILALIAAGLSTLSLVFGSFRASFGRGLLFLLLSPIIFLAWSLLARVWCEMVIVIFRIAENTSRMVSRPTAEPPNV